jgi:hypothetical protein
MSNHVDLDINSYTFDELLNIFKVKNKYIFSDSANKIKNTIHKIKNKFPEDIFLFYNKASVLLLTILQLYKENKIDDLEETNINYFINKIKKLGTIEDMEPTQIINLLNQRPGYIEQNNNDAPLYKEEQDDLHILNNSLNEKYMNVSSRINPSLNNKNNTNIVQNNFPNPVGPGYLNSLKRIVQTQNLNLNSCFRSNYYTTNPCDFLYILPSEIKNVISMRLASIDIPFSWYLLSHSKKNNIFKIKIIIKEGKEYEFHDENIISQNEFTIIIPEGNYTFESLELFLNKQYFYLSSTEKEENSLLKQIKFSINSYTMKSSFKIINSKENQTMFLSLHFMEDINQNIMNSFGWVLGFRMANYLDITDTITSEGLFDCGGDRYIYVSLNDYQYNDNNFNTVCFDKGILNEDVIAKIPMTNGKLCLNIDDDNPLTKTRRYNGPVNISRFQIKLLDKFGNIIDLNHMDYSYTLELEILYESFNFKNVIG